MKKLISLILLIFFFGCQKKDDIIEPSKSYTRSIERISSNAFEASLIEKAEAVYPGRDEVVNVAYSGFVNIPLTGYWYYNSFDGTYIPFAITKEAVNYYSGLIDLFNADKKSCFFITADFNYRATVAYENEYTSPSVNSRENPVEPEIFSSVYVVHCTLKWEQYCGSLCAMWIDKERIVVFDTEGNILKVFLDGPIAVPVS